MVVTPEDIIEHSKEIKLRNDSITRGLYRPDFGFNFLAKLSWKIKAYNEDRKTRNYFESLSRDPDHWHIEDGYHSCYLQEYTIWLKDNNIWYKIYWYKDYSRYGILFDCKESKMAFKLRWL